MKSNREEQFHGHTRQTRQIGKLWPGQQSLPDFNYNNHNNFSGLARYNSNSNSWHTRNSCHNSDTELWINNFAVALGISIELQQKE